MIHWKIQMENNSWWIENLKARDENALNELIHLIRGFIISRGLFLETGYIAVNDVVQDTIVDILDAIDLNTFEGRSSFYTWACACAKMACARAWQALKIKQQKKYQETIWKIAASQNVERDIAQRILEEEVLDIIQNMLETKKISERDWEIYKMYQLYDFSAEEVADEFEIKENNLYIICYRVQEKIKLMVNYE